MSPPSSSGRARPANNNRRRRPASATPQHHARPHGKQPRPPKSAASVHPTPNAAPLGEVSTREVPTDATFESLGVAAPIVRSLVERGVTTPFPIQAATLPDSLAGRDVLGRGRTGSGKTIAFAIPTVMALAASSKTRVPGRPRALVLVPTRELANQVTESLSPLAAAMGLRVTTIIGGVGQQPQVQALKRGVDIVVAAPGRLEDLIQQRHCSLANVEVTVLDEADHMADLGFLPSVKRLMDATPSGGQRLLFSATLDNGIDVLVQRYLVSPIIHSVDPAVAPVSTMTHHVFAVTQADKPTVVRDLAAGMDRALLFTRTKHGAKKLAKQLCMAGIPAVELHGNLSQNARERNLEAFSAGTTKVLVATDIAARGIHVDDIALVVHVDPPAEHKAYLHRSGRTARAGSEGIVVTIMTPDQVGDVKSLARAAKIEPIITRVAPGHQAVRDLVGEPAPLKPVFAAQNPRQPAPRPNGGSRPGGNKGGNKSKHRSGAARDSAARGRR
ncbi:MAG: DEAD/DEAH box helicase [Actinobacteria bacterium]|nr:DEAD/DEAH box helicase [Actinomycetota bacterium]